MKFEIPSIVWGKVDDGIYTSKNTFVEYTIIKTDGFYYCNYSGGKFKEFKYLKDAKDWVETVHYPAQVKKYFVECE